MAFAQSEFSSLKNCEKPSQQSDSRGAVAHLAHHVLLRTLIQSMIWHSVRRVHQGHRNYHEIARETGISRRSLEHKDIQLSAWRNDWSMVGNPTDHHWSSKWRDRLNACLKARGKHFLNICCDVFVHNCQFVMTFTACITVVMNRLTEVTFHKVV